MTRRIKRYLILLLLASASLISAADASRAENRVALIIGNSAYEHTTRLRNPIHDATELSKAFTRMGFQVVYGDDLTKSRLDEKILSFSKKLQDADMAVFFYAGHGIQINSKNFLIPVDFNPEKGSKLNSQLVSLDDILHEMEKGNHVSVIFLDACRANPLADQIASSLAKGRTLKIDEKRGIREVRQGLAEVEGKAGTLIAYATQPGNVALDGAGLNSPFTEALLQYVEEPGLEIRDMLTKVRMQVMNKTERMQIPWDHSSLVTDVFFKKKKRRFAPPP